MIQFHLIQYASLYPSNMWCNIFRRLIYFFFFELLKHTTVLMMKWSCREALNNNWNHLSELLLTTMEFIMIEVSSQVALNWMTQFAFVRFHSHNSKTLSGKLIQRRVTYITLEYNLLFAMLLLNWLDACMQGIFS